MIITPQEKIMYEVMKALYESNIPISFKGSMVLKAFLYEYGFKEEVRHTLDVDANWNTITAPSNEEILSSIQNAIKEMNMNVQLVRPYGRMRSAGFNFYTRDSDILLFSMDIDVNKPVIPVKLYQISDFKFSGVTPVVMITDKLFVLSTDIIFRRIKDLLDLYYFSMLFNINISEINRELEYSGKNWEIFTHS